MKNILTDKEIEDIYKIISDKYNRHLKNHGVKLPSLRHQDGQYTKDALVLVFLGQDYPNTIIRTKNEITNFIRQYYPDTNDVQQARHLGAQFGWYIAAGGRDNRVVVLKRGEYKLFSLEIHYPGFTKSRRANQTNWDDVKNKYGYRCATCGSVEGKPHLHWPGTITKIQKSHKDPRLELTDENSIPQCQKCNRADKNWWVYDDKGRVIKIANARILLRCDDDVKKEAYTILYEYFNGAKPEEVQGKNAKR
ncbi:MAG: hypothetical protein FJY65_02375 [Calditrichaeota bacterium]|nr:hypothetical protein [Calditrichota bacterium]